MELERPDHAEGLTHFVRGPVPFGTKLHVEEDDQAVFVQNGQALGVVAEGTYDLNPSELPFLAQAGSASAAAYECDLWFVRRFGTVDVDGNIHPGTLRGMGLYVEASFEVEVTDPARAVASVMDASAESLDAALDQQLFFALPATVDRMVARHGWPDDLSDAAEGIAGAAEEEGLDFERIGARFAGFVELHLHEGEGDEDEEDEERPKAERPIGPGTFTPGARVMAQAGDGKFYPASIRQMVAGKIEVAWDDGRTGWLTPYQVRRG